MVLGVPILKHFRVFLGLQESKQLILLNIYLCNERVHYFNEAVERKVENMYERRCSIYMFLALCTHRSLKYPGSLLNNPRKCRAITL